MINSKYMIFDNDGNYFEYNAKDVFEALDKYVLMDCCDFHISIEMWNRVKDSCKEVEERINLVNELCDYNNNKIDRIIGTYTYVFGDEISPIEDESLN